MRAPRPCRWLSRLPPCRPAHPFVISSPSVATPTTPTIGRAWNEIRSFIRTVSRSTSNTNVTGESTSATSCPNSGPKPQITSSRETRCSVATAIGGAILLPGRRAMNPAPARHRRDDLAPGEILERIRREHDEVRQEAGQQLAAAPLVVGQPGRRDAGRLQRLFERHRFLGAPIEPAADARERIEFLDRRVGAVRDDRAALPERAKPVRAVGAFAPETVDELAVRRCVHELHRRRYPELHDLACVLVRNPLPHAKRQRVV